MFLVMIRVTSRRFSFSWSRWFEGPAALLLLPPPWVSVLESRYRRVVLEMNVSASGVSQKDTARLPGTPYALGSSAPTHQSP